MWPSSLQSSSTTSPLPRVHEKDNHFPYNISNLKRTSSMIKTIEKEPSENREDTKVEETPLPNPKRPVHAPLLRASSMPSSVLVRAISKSLNSK